MLNLKAIHYGNIQIVPNVKCDSYVLDNNLAVLSERGTAKTKQTQP